MKTLTLVALVAAAFISIAATCTATKTSLTTIDGRATFAGQVTNDTGADLLGHRIVVAFLDEDGNVVETRTTKGCLRTLQAGASNFFAVRSSEDPDDVDAGIARVAIDGSIELGEARPADLRIRNVSALRKDDLLTVAGSVRNNHDDDLDDVNVCVVVKSDDGDIVTVANAKDDFDLDEGEARQFSVEIDVPDHAGLVDEISVWVDAEDDGVPTEPRSKSAIEVECQPSPTPTSTPTATATATAGPGIQQHGVC